MLNMLTMPTGYRIIATGAISGETAATALPAIRCKYVYLKSQSGNAGNAYIGIANTVIAPTDSTTSALVGIELAAGGDILLKCPGSVMSGLFLICANAGDDLTYVALG